MRLLIVEDNAKLSGVMAKLLNERGMVVDVAETVEEARAAITIGPYDVILLDLGLPDGDGIDLLHILRRAGDGTRVLVATARGAVGERVRALDDGADDYVVKPFSLDELQARIRALLRRPTRQVGPILRAGNVELDLDATTLTVAGASVEVVRQEILVLAALIRNQGKLLSRARLEHAIYNLDEAVTPNALEAAISRLRRRLERAEATVSITAMRGLGWLLSTPH